MWRSSVSNPNNKFFVRQHDKHQSLYLKVWTPPIYVTFLVFLMVHLSKITEKQTNIMKQSWQDFHSSVCLAICLSSKDWLIRSFCIKLLKSKKLQSSLFWEISHVQCWPRAKSTYFQCEFAMWLPMLNFIQWNLN